jgi:hypothetical protein
VDPFSIPVYDLNNNNNHNIKSASTSSTDNNNNNSNSRNVINHSSSDEKSSLVNDPYKHFVPLLVIPSEEGKIFFVTIILIILYNQI